MKQNCDNGISVNTPYDAISTENNSHKIILELLFE